MSMFKEYSEKSSIHGIQYLGDQKRNFIEKTFWIFVLILSFIWCIILIVQIWIKWDENTITMTFDDSIMDVKELWFPAVTICPNKKVPKDERDFYEKLIQSHLNRHEYIEYSDPECVFNQV